MAVLRTLAISQTSIGGPAAPTCVVQIPESTVAQLTRSHMELGGVKRPVQGLWM